MPAQNFAKTTFTQIANNPQSMFQRIPEAVRTDLNQIKALLNTEPNAFNEYVSAMVTRIGRMLIDAPNFVDPFAVVSKGKNEMSHLVQDLHINPITASGKFNPAGPAPLARKDDENVTVQYYQTNYQPYYQITVDRVGMMDAMGSWDDLNRFWAAKMQAMYTGASIDRYNARLNALSVAMADTQNPMSKAYIGAFTAKDTASGQALVQAIKVVLADLRFPNTANRAGVINVNNRDDLVLVVNKSVYPNLDVYTLASLFNVEYLDMVSRVIVVDTFGNNNPNALAVLADKKLFQFYDTMTTVRPIENPQGLFTNFFYHPWGIVQISNTATGVVFVGADAAK